MGRKWKKQGKGAQLDGGADGAQAVSGGDCFSLSVCLFLFLFAVFA